GVLAIPHRDGEADALARVADAGDAVFVPAVRLRARVIVRHVVPRRAVRRVVLAHGAPRTLAQIGAPLLPVLRSRVGLRKAQLLVGQLGFRLGHRGWTSITWPSGSRSARGAAPSAKSVVRQCMTSSARSSGGIGRPLRGIKYSRSSTPGPSAARSVVMRRCAP